MIRIRPPQEQALSEAAWEVFREDVEASLQKMYSKRTAGLPEGRLSEVVASAVASARARGMAGDRTISVYVECAFVFGPPPWKEPFAEPLADGGLPPEVRHARFRRLAEEALAPHREGGAGPAAQRA